MTQFDPATRTILDVHILQTVPPSNINRDDTGSPKTAVYGGVRRSRVSSQAWKRATRKKFEELLDPSELGVRTKKVAEALADRLAALDPSLDRATALELAAESLRNATGSKIEAPKRKIKDGEPDPAPESSYLMFLSAQQLDSLAELTVKGAEGKGDIKVLKEFFKAKENKVRARQLVDSGHSVDIALFGRMVADATDLNVEAATQVAHALSVHAVDNESDYYTAVDDRNTDAETGAGMIGVVDFNSSTLYRYAALDVNRLHANLGAGLRRTSRPALRPGARSRPSSKASSPPCPPARSTLSATTPCRPPSSSSSARSGPSASSPPSKGRCPRARRAASSGRRAHAWPASYRTWRRRTASRTPTAPGSYGSARTPNR